MASNKNLISIDILRAMTALLVYACHAQLGKLAAKTTGIEYFKLIDHIGATYAVPIFFILSGYCIEIAVKNAVKKQGKFSTKDFYKRRLKRIYPTYILALLCSIIVECTTNSNFTLNTFDLLTHLLMVHGLTVNYFGSINIVFWTLTIELGFYLLYPIFYHLKQKTNTNFALFACSTLSCISMLYFSKSTIPFLPRDLYFPLNLFSAWLLGCALQEAVHSENTTKKILNYYFICLTPLIILSYTTQGIEPIIKYNLTIIFSGLVLLLFIALENKLTLKNPLVNLMAKIGLSSYSLYLFHQPLINLKIYLAEFITYQPLKNFSHLIIAPVIIFGCYIIYMYIEKPLSLTKKANA